jgi:hypothetical protein
MVFALSARFLAVYNAKMQKTRPKPGFLIKQRLD